MAKSLIFITFVLSSLFLSCLSFSIRSRNRHCSTLCGKSSFNNDLDSKLKFKKVVTSSIIFSLSFYLSPLSIFQPLDLNTQSNVAVSIVQPANADVRAQQKRTYFRFAPKLKLGCEFYKSDLKKAIDTEDWNAVTKFFEVYVSKYNPNDPTQIDSTDTYVNNHLFRPMTVLSGSFAERGASPKQRALMEQESALEEAMTSLEGCVKTQKESGLFGREVQMPTGVERSAQAQNAWNLGKTAINKYIDIFNSGLMLELNSLQSI